jgi:hypothetical protein
MAQVFMTALMSLSHPKIHALALILLMFVTACRKHPEDKDGVLYTNLCSATGLTSAEQLQSTCSKGKIGDDIVGIAVCALAEQNRADVVKAIVASRISPALNSPDCGDEAFMLGKALVMLGENELPFMDSMLASSDPKVRRWAVGLLGFFRGSDAALMRLIKQLDSSTGEERVLLLYSISQYGSLSATKYILRCWPVLDVNERRLAARYLMSCVATEELRPLIETIIDNEQDGKTRENLERFLKSI